MNVRNLFDVSPIRTSEHELFERLAHSDEVLVERILSAGQTTPQGEWYDEEQDEWVVLIQGQATLSFEDRRTQDLRPGDSIFLPAHVKHRVEFTSADPPCVWVAVHARMQEG